MLAADAPLSDAERGILEMFSDRRMRTFVIVNRCDHLTQAELAQVRAFIEVVVNPPIWAMLARAAAALADRLLVAQRFNELCGLAGDRLDRLVADAFGRRAADLRGAAGDGGLRGLEDRLGTLTESIVAEKAAAARTSESAWAQQAWTGLASWFRRLLDERVSSIRTAASGLLDVQLGPLEGPPLEAVPGRFTLNFHHEASVIEPVDRLTRALIPSPIRRRRASRRAVQRLHRLLDRNAGRVRHDLTGQLRAARRDLERTTEQELDHVIASSTRGAERGLRPADRNRATHDSTHSTLERVNELRSVIAP